MIYWAPLLHFYQPPLQLYQVLRKVCDESYRPLVRLFKEHPYAKVTVNICGILTEQLWESGMDDVIHGLRDLAEGGQVEFTGSAKYHPILPLIPHEEISWQIRRNYLTNRHFFGEAYSPRGFFPPEMAYGPEVVEPVLEGRHQWLILSGVACPTAWPQSVVHEIRRGELAVFFRDDILSNKISFQGIDNKGFLEHLRSLGNGTKDVYVVTAMDAETFGHHIQNWERLFLAEVYEALEPAQTAYRSLKQSHPLAEEHRELLALGDAEDHQIEVVTISELLDLFPRATVVAPRASSWSTSEADLKQNNPYPLWKNPNNPVHQLQWEHLGLVLEMVAQAEAVADTAESRRFAEIARGLLDMALHSCQFWWANKPGLWDINMISKGLGAQREALFNGCKAIRTSGCPETLKKEGYYKMIVARHLRHHLTDHLLLE